MEIERMKNDPDALVTRVYRVEGSITDLTRRLDLLQQADTFSDRAQTTRDTHLENRFTGLEKKIDDFRSEVTKKAEKQDAFLRQIFLIVAAAIIGVVVTFAMKGGFSVPRI